MKASIVSAVAKIKKGTISNKDLPKFAIMSYIRHRDIKMPIDDLELHSTKGTKYDKYC